MKVKSFSYGGLDIRQHVCNHAYRFAIYRFFFCHAEVYLVEAPLSLLKWGTFFEYSMTKALYPKLTSLWTSKVSTNFKIFGEQ